MKLSTVIGQIEMLPRYVDKGAETVVLSDVLSLLKQVQTDVTIVEVEKYNPPPMETMG